ncbi:HupE/UreJ family protein [Agromyces sp. SYSU T0242]|uniref:HupE/UreJ family protein n=1 Tax=Agromyces litoreus TaxID=3158561 RepID=UPI0033990F44
MSRLARAGRRAVAAFIAVTAAALLALAPTAAYAHSVDSTAVTLTVGADSVDGTIQIPLVALDEALGTAYAADPSTVATDADDLVAYIAEHLTATGADGSSWGETFGEATVTTIEDVAVLSVDVTLDPVGADPGDFTFGFDGIIADGVGHEVTVVVTDADGSIGLAGVITEAEGAVTIGDVTDAAASADPGILDMVVSGYHHVMDGADHLLFVFALLLPAPLIALAGRWRSRAGEARPVRDSVWSVVRVATAFTAGHSITLIAAAMGWVDVPSQPVEILIAVSVGIAAIHAMRPLVRRGEVIIAAAFGLIHGLAFAGILADLGFDGNASWPVLLAFNVGIELAQLAAIALVLPSLLVLARTRWYAPVRLAAAGIAVVAATAWVLDRIGLITDPLSGVEEALIATSWTVPVTFAALATAAVVHGRLLERRASRAVAGGERETSLGSPPTELVR